MVAVINAVQYDMTHYHHYGIPLTCHGGLREDPGPPIILIIMVDVPTARETGYAN